MATTLHPDHHLTGGHTIEMEGRVARCIICGQSWGDCNSHDVRNLQTEMRCPGRPIKAVACPRGVTCWNPDCIDGCARRQEQLDAISRGARDLYDRFA